MAWKKTVPVVLALAAALVLTSCGGQEMTAEEIQAAAVEAAVGIETVRFDMDMLYAMSVENEESFDTSVPTTMTGVVDQKNQEMQIEMSTVFLPPGEEPQTMEMQMYIVDEMLYISGVMPGEPEFWIKQELPPGYWEQATGFRQAIGLLEFSQVVLVGSEFVDGTDCYVLEVEPAIGRLWEALMQQPGMSEFEGAEILESFDLEDMVEIVNVRQWVAKDKIFPTKQDTEMRMVMDTESMNLPVEEEGHFRMTMDMAMVALYDDFNRPVSIVLPGEAEEAPEMPLL